jgi:peptidyl-dipeptidase Dcp
MAICSSKKIEMSYSLARISVLVVLSITVTAFTFTKYQKKIHTEQEQMADLSDSTSNPLLASWQGPYNGFPPFDKVKIEYFKPALERSMAEDEQEINNIINGTSPTFDNTIAALERSGHTLERVRRIYGVWSSNMNTKEFKPVEEEMEPKLAAFDDKIFQNSSLFKRIETVYNSPAKAQLTPEQQRLTWRYYTEFVRAGARLSEADKAKVSETNQQLAVLFTKFNQNQLADENDRYLELKSEADLAGLPQSVRDAAAASAVEKNKKGSWVINNTRSSIDPFLTYSDRRELREKAWRMFINRGDNGDDHDNNANISKILKLRAQRAKLLGYPTHAHMGVDDVMAKTPERAMELMEAVWKPAVARVHQEVADMQAIADKEKAGITIEPWDYRYYAEKVRKSKYDLDQTEVKQYLQLDKLRDGMFWVAGELFGFQFTLLPGVPVYHPDVKVWKVSDKTTGRQIGLWYFDPYARPGKRSGAWMNEYRNQGRMDKEITAIVSNNSNFIKGNPGEPVLISWDDAETLFHEFGHALHGLSSNVTYPLLSGTNVARDYVEFPSQILERWLSTPEVLQHYALHYKTGKPIPQSLVDKIKKASTFNQGFLTVEYLASAIVDMEIHLAGEADINPKEFEKKTLAALGMPKEMVMRHRLPAFGHLFSDDEYAAGYYSYIWADVISADAYQAFMEAGGPYDKVVAKRMYDMIFSVGNTNDQGEAFRNFRGRDAKIDALMEHRGFPKTATK